MKAILAVLAMVSLVIPATGALAQQGGMTWRLDIPRPEKGCEFPDFPLPDTAGKMVWFNDYRGKPLLLTFCSCYTDTCCPILNELEQVRARFSGRVTMILVCCETSPALAQDGYLKLRQQCRDIADRVLIDDGWLTRVPFLVSELPTTYLIDPAFCLRFKAVSVADLNTPEFAAELERVVAGQQSPP
jgi:hypothetical protein